MKIKKNDKVVIVLGKDRGRSAKVLQVLPKKKKVLVEGVNVYKRHINAKRRGVEGKGGILDITKSVDISNVMLVCPNCKKPTRVGMKNGASLRARVCKKCGGEINRGNK